MCRLFTGADPDLWQSTTRSRRIEGFVTSVHLESFFWTILADIAQRDSLTLSRLITRLQKESVEEGRDLDNFASFLRVCCSRYLTLQLTDGVPRYEERHLGPRMRTAL